jgi:hypothetical protein
MGGDKQRSWTICCLSVAFVYCHCPIIKDISPAVTEKWASVFDCKWCYGCTDSVGGVQWGVSVDLKQLVVTGVDTHRPDDFVPDLSELRAGHGALPGLGDHSKSRSV